jgi:hypothetical protein
LGVNLKSVSISDAIVETDNVPLITYLHLEYGIDPLDARKSGGQVRWVLDLSPTGKDLSALELEYIKSRDRKFYLYHKDLIRLSKSM